MLILILLTSLFTTLSIASDVGITGTQGPDEYQALSVDALVDLSKKWSLNGSYFQSDSGVGLLNEKLVSKSGRLGLGWEMNQTWNFAAEFVSRQDPYEVKGRGAALSLRSVVSDFWKSKSATSLSLKIEQLKYSQDLTLRGPRASFEIDREITQKSGTVTLDQEFTLWISASLSHTRYNYSDGVGKLTRTTARRRTSFGGRSANYGLPDYVNTFGIELTPWEWSALHLTTTESKVLNNETKIKTNSIGVSFYWKSWQLDIEGSRSIYGDVSGKDNPTQDYSSLGISYSW
jgi:hypothetical protein